jgi:DEAD/DEAH box helicase domain-containing protein
MNFVVFDIETYSPGNLQKIDTKEFRVSVTGAYISWIDEYIAFMEDDTKDFLEVLKQADLVVGYNHLWFDLPVLQKYSDFNLLDLPSYDIMIEAEKKIGFKLKLDDLCKANLNSKKTDSYEVYKHYHAEKKWAPLIDYCMNDVKLTTELFLKIINEGKLIYNDLLDVKEITFDKPKPGKKIENSSKNDANEAIF